MYTNNILILLFNFRKNICTIFPTKLQGLQPVMVFMNFITNSISIHIDGNFPILKKFKIWLPPLYPREKSLFYFLFCFILKDLPPKPLYLRTTNKYCPIPCGTCQMIIMRVSFTCYIMVVRKICIDHLVVWRTPCIPKL